MKRRSIIVGCLVGLALFINACATFKKPATIKEAPVLERALTEEKNGIRVSVAIVGEEEARQIFGIDLARKNIQAFWVEIENNTTRPLVLLPAAIYPEYFAPLEVAYAYQSRRAASRLPAEPVNVVIIGSIDDWINFFNWQRLADYR